MFGNVRKWWRVKVFCVKRLFFRFGLLVIILLVSVIFSFIWCMIFVNCFVEVFINVFLKMFIRLVFVLGVFRLIKYFLGMFLYL